MPAIKESYRQSWDCPLEIAGRMRLNKLRTRRIRHFAAPGAVLSGTRWEIEGNNLSAGTLPAFVKPPRSSQKVIGAIDIFHRRKLWVGMRQTICVCPFQATVSYIVLMRM